MKVVKYKPVVSESSPLDESIQEYNSHRVNLLKALNRMQRRLKVSPDLEYQFQRAKRGCVLRLRRMDKVVGKISNEAGK